jgi:hypothetical protein
VRNNQDVIQARESSHYTGGKYIRIHDGDDFTFERISGSEYLIRGFENSIEVLLALSSRVSSRLAILKIRHRFELYADSNEMMHYLHHDWPQNTT